MPVKTIDHFFSIPQDEMAARCIKKALELPVKLIWGFPVRYETRVENIMSDLAENTAGEAGAVDNSDVQDCIKHAVSTAYFAVSNALDTPLGNFRCGSILGAIRFRNDFAIMSGRNALANYCESACHDQNWYWLFVELFGSPN